MALVVKDRVKETTATTGTGTLTLAGADTGFQSFSSALSDGDTTYYSLVELSTGSWEVGLGTFTATGTTLARTTILASSNSGSAINLTAGEASVFITQPAGKAAFFDSNGDLILNQDPTTALMAATKEYVDTIAAAGIHYHDPVRVESPDTAGNLNATYNNGSSGVGATLTNAGTQAALVIDGVTVNTNDRVLIYSQTNGYENGIYTVTNTGSASTNWVLTRATDADSYGPSDPDSLGQGDAFFVKEGDTGAGELYVMNTAGEIIFGTTNIMFTVVAETAVYSAGDGLSLTGTTFAVGQGTGVTVSSSTVSIGQAVGTSDSPTFSSLSVTNAIDAASLSIDNVAPSIYLLESDTTDLNTRFRTNGGSLNIQTSNDANTSNVSRFSIDHSTGDISFYEDTGTTAEFFWDASAESLGIGTTSPSQLAHLYESTAATGAFLQVQEVGGQNAYFGVNTSGGSIQVSGANPLQIATNGTERMRIDSSGRVGIGTTSPIYAADIKTSGTNNGQLRVGGGSTSATGLLFEQTNSGTTTANIQNSYYSTSASASLSIKSGYTTFHTGTSGAEAARIDASGNLLVGRTDTNVNTVGALIGASGYNYFTRDGGYAALFNRKTSDGDIVEFRKDATKVGSIASRAGVVTSMILDPRTGGGGLTGGGAALYPTDNAGSPNDGVLTLGDASSRFNNLYLSGAAYTHSIAKQTTNPIVINSTFSSSKALRVYYDMDIYNTINFTDASWSVQGYINGSSGNLNLTPATGGSVQITSTNDAMLKLIGQDTWAGISFDDSGSVTDYIWYNGTYGTFAIGGGGSSVSGKKLHVDGGMTIGANYDTTAPATNGLTVEGNTTINGGIYTNEWFRNNTSGYGLYNQATTQHFYSDNDDGWTVAGGGSANWIRFRDDYNTTIRGSVYATNANEIGFLDAGGSWAIRHVNDAGTYFYTDNGTEEFRVGRDTVTGDYGTVQTITNTGGWGGYSINGQHVFMANGTNCGIYNDIDNEWMVYAERNGASYLYYNGSYKLNTNSSGVTVVGTCTATAFSGDGSSLTNVPGPTTGFTVTGTITATKFTATSDINLKENLEILESPTDKLSAISGYSYNFKETGEKSYGVIAQEVESVLPDAVHTNDKGNKSVEYNAIIALLVEAVKSQQVQIDELTRKLEG